MSARGQIPHRPKDDIWRCDAGREGVPSRLRESSGIPAHRRSRKDESGNRIQRQEHEAWEKEASCRDGWGCGAERTSDSESGVGENRETGPETQPFRSQLPQGGRGCGGFCRGDNPESRLQGGQLMPKDLSQPSLDRVAHNCRSHPSGDNSGNDSGTSLIEKHSEAHKGSVKRDPLQSDNPVLTTRAKPRRSRQP
jgi:hypothetical protein